MVSINFIAIFLGFNDFTGGGIDLSIIFGSNGYWTGIGGIYLYFSPLAFILIFCWEFIDNKRNQRIFFYLIVSIPLLYYIYSILSRYLSYGGINLYTNSLLFLGFLFLILLFGGFVLLSAFGNIATFSYHLSISNEKRPLLIFFFVLSLVFYLFIFLFLTIPTYSGLRPDSLDFLLIAEQLFSGDFLIPKLLETPHRGILYSIFLTPLLYLPGDVVLKAQILSIILTSFLIIVLVDIVWLLNGKKTAIIAGFTSIFTPFLWMQSFMILTSITSLIFISLSLDYLLRLTYNYKNRPKSLNFALLGFVIGLAILARFQNFFLLLFPILISIIYYYREKNNKNGIMELLKKLLIVFFSAVVTSFPLLFLKYYYHSNPFTTGITSNYFFADSNFEAQFLPTVDLSKFLDRHGLLGFPFRVLEGFLLFFQDTEKYLGLNNIYGSLIIVLLLSGLSLSLLPIACWFFKKENITFSILPLTIYFIVNFTFFSWIRPIITVRVTLNPILPILLIIFPLSLSFILENLPKKGLGTRIFFKLSIQTWQEILLLMIIFIPIIIFNINSFSVMEDNKLESEAVIEAGSFLRSNFNTENHTISVDAAVRTTLSYYQKIIFSEYVILDFFLQNQSHVNPNQSVIEDFFIQKNVSLLVLCWNTSYYSPIFSTTFLEDIFYEKASFQRLSYTKIFQLRDLKIFSLEYF